MVTRKGIILKVLLMCNLTIIAYFLYYLFLLEKKVFIINENHYMFWVLLFFQIFNVVLIFIELRSLPKEK